MSIRKIALLIGHCVACAKSELTRSLNSQQEQHQVILKVLIGSLKLKADRFKASQSIEMMPMSLNVRAPGCETDLSRSFYAFSVKVYKSCKLRFVQVKPD